MRTPKIEIYRTVRVLSVKALEEPGNPAYTKREFRWRHRAANGRIVAESGEGYLEPRNLVRGLEIAHPGHLLQRDGAFLGGRWWLVSPTGMGVHMEDIPVTVPEGTESLWSARRKR